MPQINLVYFVSLNSKSEVNQYLFHVEQKLNRNHNALRNLLAIHKIKIVQPYLMPGSFFPIQSPLNGNRSILTYGELSLSV